MNRFALAALAALAIPLAGCSIFRPDDGTAAPVSIRSHVEAEGKASATIDVATYGLPTRVLHAMADAGGTVDVDTARTPPVIATGSWKVVRDENPLSAPGAIDIRAGVPQAASPCAGGACAPPSTSAAVTSGAETRCGPLPTNAKPGEVWCCIGTQPPSAPAFQVEVEPARLEWQRVPCASAGGADCWALIPIPAKLETRVPAAPPIVYQWTLTDCSPAPAAAAPEPCAPAPAARAPSAPSRCGLPVYRNCKGEAPTQVNNPSTNPRLPAPGTGWPCPQPKAPGAAADACPHGVAAIISGIIEVLTFQWLGGLAP